MRQTDEALELCAGREGDDAYVRIPLARPLSREELHDLEDVLVTYFHSVSRSE